MYGRGPSRGSLAGGGSGGGWGRGSGQSRGLWWLQGGLMAGRRPWRRESCVGRGRAARLGCGQATMAAWAAWLRVLSDWGGGSVEAPGFITYPVCVWSTVTASVDVVFLLAGSVVVLLLLPYVPN